jgi:small subunit ribosomal protein S1
VGDGIEGLVHISEMSAHHVESPEQVVTPGEELWVKIIDLDLARRRISLSIKQAAEGGELAEEYREHFGIDEQGNYTVTDDAEREAAWAEYFEELGTEGGENAVPPEGEPPSRPVEVAEVVEVVEVVEVPGDEPEVVEVADVVEVAGVADVVDEEPEVVEVVEVVEPVVVEPDVLDAAADEA